MKKVDKIFYLVYNFYYKDGNYRSSRFSKFLPEYYTIFILSMGTMLWGIFFTSAVLFYVKNQFVNKSFVPFFAVFFIASYPFYYTLFISNSRYEEIYEHFKKAIKIRRSHSILAVLFVIAFPVILILLSSLIWHQLL